MREDKLIFVYLAFFIVLSVHLSLVSQFFRFLFVYSFSILFVLSFFVLFVRLFFFRLLVCLTVLYVHKLCLSESSPLFWDPLGHGHYNEEVTHVIEEGEGEGDGGLGEGDHVKGNKVIRTITLVHLQVKTTRAKWRLF